MRKTRQAVLACALLSLSSIGVGAQEQPANLIDAPEPPPLPAPVVSGETLEPDITIIQRQEEQVVEYRQGGRLVAIKVVPKNRDFPAYYLVDTDNDGRLDTRTHDLSSDILVNSWVLMTW